MNSRLYKGHVFHRRLGPEPHVFHYPVHFYGLDLAELPRLDEMCRTFGYNRRGIISIHDSDYLDPESGDLMEKFSRRIANTKPCEFITRVVLISSARTLGYVFNPVSFFLGLNEEGDLQLAIAEVNNTFGDRHLYVLDSLYRASPEAREWRATAPKAFHVSPFNDMQGEYRFCFRLKENELSVDVNLYKGQEPILETRLSGHAEMMNDAAILKTLIRHPVRAAATMPRIVKEAARLKWQKKLKAFRRPEPRSPDTVIRRVPSRVQRLARDYVLKMLANMSGPGLSIVLPDGQHVQCGARDDGLTLYVRDYRFFTRIVTGGAVAFGECFTDGDVDVHDDDLHGVLSRLLQQREAIHDGRSLVSRVLRVKDNINHLTRSNTRRQSRNNIHAHYDISNAFFKLWLDPTMTYSAALYRRHDESLESAQRNKLNALIDLARIETSHHILEIGTGWGSFAIQAASRIGCRVTTVTISEEQHALARRRVREAGLDHLVDVQFCDYREIEGKFDRIISIEMIEAVGPRYLSTFFEQCDKVLAQDGLLVLQAITIPDHRYDAYRKGCDWIQKYIFPGGHLPSLGALNSAMHHNTTFYIEHLSNIGLHYGRTLRDWRELFTNKRQEVLNLGFDEPFIRQWFYYLNYCEAAFGSAALNALHLVISRPQNATLIKSPTNPGRCFDENASFLNAITRPAASTRRTAPCHCL